MVTKLKSAAPFALIAIFVGALVPFLFGIAILTDGFWTFNVNTLSDLGVSPVEATAMIFNYTCIIAGLLVVIFGIGKLFIRCGYDAASGFFTAIGGILLMAIGFITEDYSTHLPIAYSFFAIMTIAILISAAGDVTKERNITVAITAIVVVIILATAFGLNVAGVEVVSVIGMCVWLIAQGFSLVFSKA